MSKNRFSDVFRRGKKWSIDVKWVRVKYKFQKQLPEVFIKKFRKFHRKTPVPESEA